MLTDEDRVVLDIAGRYYRAEGSRVNAIRDDLGMNPTRFYQRLNELLDEPAAAEQAPTLVARLRRLRDRRTRQRRAA